jgi:hypothetical protein
MKMEVYPEESKNQSMGHASVIPALRRQTTALQSKTLSTKKKKKRRRKEEEKINHTKSFFCLSALGK